MGPDDVVLLTVVPGRGGIGSIGLAIASIALIAVAPYAAPALATALGGVSVTAVEAGLGIGGWRSTMRRRLPLPPRIKAEKDRLSPASTPPARAQNGLPQPMTSYGATRISSQYTGEHHHAQR